MPPGAPPATPAGYRRGHPDISLWATTITGDDGSRQPSANELEGAGYLGRHVAEIAAKVAA